jgi:hypothetical protein
VTTLAFAGGPAFPLANTFFHTANLRTDTVRVGLNYKFGNYYAPVVTK